MKFGRKISTDLYDEWREKYLEYNRLKKFLKQRTTDHEWNAQDEQDFVSLLEEELEKIHQFQRKKTKELAQRIALAEGVVQSFVYEFESSDLPHPRTSQPSTGPDPELGQPSGDGDVSDDDDDDDEGERMDSDDASAVEETFRGLEEEVATLVADVHDLALYTKLNFTGFIKIVKKHDKRTNLSLKTTFIQDFLDKRPFYKYNWDSLIVKLSRLYDLVRTRGHPVEGDSGAGGNQSAFVRQTTKYWVHPDNLVHLKLAILRHLPVLVFNPKKEFESKDAAITSIYFDNEDLDLYLGRLEKTEGAEAIRLRWYGDMDVKQIFVERKTHREDWTGEKSVKARFPIKAEHVNDFLAGAYSMNDSFAELSRKGKRSASEVENMKQLAHEVQYAVLSRKLKPVMRTFYNRTAFQLPGDARVRISLDTELTMVREDNWDGRSRAGNNWRRGDIGIDWPFDQLPKEDKENFPYGVLEIKLQTQMGQEPPAWVTDLVKSHLVEAVPKFSKFIHGCATLLPSRVDLVPFWLPQMDIDIRKPDTGAIVLERPSGHGSHSESRATSDSETLTPLSEKEPYTEPLSEGEEDEEMDVDVAQDENVRVGLTTTEAAEAIAFRKKNLAAESAHNGGDATYENGDGDGEGTLPSSKRPTYTAKQGANLLINPLVSSAAFDEALTTKLQLASRSSVHAEEADVRGPSAEEDIPKLTREWHAESGKRISVPVRVEPKVFFASERTFLMWLQFAVILGGIATGLLNFISANDSAGVISAFIFTAAALASIAYSTGVFIYRSYKLRARDADGLYYDKFGPTVLCGLLFTALATNVVLRLVDM